MLDCADKRPQESPSINPLYRFVTGMGLLPVTKSSIQQKWKHSIMRARIAALRVTELEVQVAQLTALLASHP